MFFFCLEVVCHRSTMTRAVCNSSALTAHINCQFYRELWPFQSLRPMAYEKTYTVLVGPIRWYPLAEPNKPSSSSAMRSQCVQCSCSSSNFDQRPLFYHLTSKHLSCGVVSPSSRPRHRLI